VREIPLRQPDNYDFLPSRDGLLPAGKPPHSRRLRGSENPSRKENLRSRISMVNQNPPLADFDLDYVCWESNEWRGSLGIRDYHGYCIFIFLTVGCGQYSAEGNGMKVVPFHLKISVVDYEGERLFEYEGAKFDALEAFDVFCGGQLSVMRGGKIIDRTRQIAVVGTHGACMSFCGLRKVFPGRVHDPRDFASLSSEYYRTGDVIILDFFGPSNFDLVGSSKDLATGLSALMASFEEKPTWDFNELIRSVAQKAPAAADALSKATVIRLREK
jgi:hypothetical protein